MKPSLASGVSGLPSAGSQAVGPDQSDGFDPPVQLGNNECHLPPPEPVRRAMQRAAATTNRYPSAYGARLREALAAASSVTTAEVVLGAGSADVLLAAWRAAARPESAAVFAVPAFPLYELASEWTGLRSWKVPVTAEYQQNLRRMVAAANEPATRLMVLCNPHNPTGTFVSSDELAQMIQAIPADVLVLIDEAYCEFADAPEFPQPVPELIRRTNVLVTRTFSKAYGLAGARVGYGLGHPGLIARLRASQPPFQLSSVAQAGALAWLERPADVLARTAKVRTERARLSRELARRGFRVVPSQANFVFVIGAERPWASELLVRGVEVRQFQDGFRVTIGSNADHGRLLAAIDEIADGDGHL